MPPSLPYHRWQIPSIATATIGLALTGCAYPAPNGPTVMALPAHGEDFALFEQHDTTCRQYASSQTGGRSAGQAGVARGIAGAAAGTGIGAASGALIGSASGAAGAGAAIGAGAGLLAGTLLGAAHGHATAAAVQSRYNMAYTQCMVGNGETVTASPGPYPGPAYVAYRPVPVYAGYVLP
jgi:hypothetical protein